MSDIFTGLADSIYALHDNRNRSGGKEGIADTQAVLELLYLD